ncbi:MAG: response regulator transcription factor [Acidobacteriota bacterium]
METEVSVLIADDHPVFRRGLRQVIESESIFRVVAEADDGRSALELIRAHRPRIAVLDIHMPEMGGFDLIREIKREKLAVEVIFLTMYDDESMFNAAMDLGAKGYVLKDSAISDIIASLRSVAANRPYISPALSGFLLSRSERATRLASQQPGLNLLTATERRILKLVSEYKTSKEIASELHIHYRTVDNHRTNISQKLGLKGSHALLKFALEHKSEI